MRWSIYLRSFVFAIVAGLWLAPAACACPLCFGSSGPGVLRAYLVSAFFMIALAWAAIGAIALYAVRTYPEKALPNDTAVHLKAHR
jgi:hypothetical protein